MTNNGSVSNKIFWRGFWWTIIFLVVIFLIAVFTANENNRVSLSADGKHVVLSNEFVDHWKKNLPNVFGTIGEEFDVKALGRIEGNINEKIDEVFDPVYEQIPKFAEFHYSVTGEYTEIVAALSGKMGGQVQEVLFKEIGFDENLKQKLDSIHEFSKNTILVAGQTVNGNIQNTMALDDDEMNLLTKTLNLSTEDVKDRFTSLKYTTIRGAGMAMGLSATGSVLAKAMGKKLATKIATKAAVKAATKATTIVEGAGAGALGCAAGGPVASLICGIGGGALVWLTVDKFIVEIDEHFNREGFEKDLRDMVDEQKQEFKKGLKDFYASVITSLVEEQKNKLKSVSPAELAEQ